MHYMDANKTYGEKVWRQLHKNAASSSCTAIYLPSRKLSKLDEPDMQDTARDVRTNS